MCLLLLFFSPVVWPQASPPDAQLQFHAVPLSKNPASFEVQAHQPLEGTDAIGDYETALDEIRETAGAFDRSQLEQLDSLGFLYQDAGDHHAAISMFEQAMLIIRVNEGLFAPGQQHYMDAIIESHMDLGDYRAADDMQAALFYMASKNHPDGSQELRSAEQRWAEWNLEYFTRHYLYRDDAPVIRISHTVSVYSDPQRSLFRSPFDERSMFGQRRQQLNPLRTGHNLSAESSRLSLARDIYQPPEGQALSLNDRESLRQLVAIEYYRYLESLHVLGQQTFGNDLYPVTYRDVAYIARNTYHHGRNLLEQIIDMAPSASRENLLARLDLADWDLVFNHQQRAFDGYAALYRDLAAQGEDEAAIARFFQPSALVPLPRFVNQPYAADPDFIEKIDTEGYTGVAHQGYIDVEIELDRRGSLRRLKILEASPDTSGHIRSALRDYLNRGVFRPAIIEGRAVGLDTLALRYYYTY